MRTLVYVPNTSNSDAILQSIETALPENDHQTEHALNDQDLTQLLRLYDFDVVVLGADGTSINQAQRAAIVLKQQKRPIPSIVVGYALTPPQHELMLEKGASSVVDIKSGVSLSAILPLMAKNLSGLNKGQGDEIETGAWFLNQATHTITYNGNRIDLTPQEYNMLSYMIRNEGKSLSKDSIYEGIYRGEDQEAEIKIIDVYMSKIRKKLAAVDAEAVDCFETIWGHGYKFSGSGTKKQDHQIKRFGKLSVNYTAAQVFWDDQPVPLSITEYMVLKTVCFNYPRPSTTNELIGAASQYGREADEDTIIRCITNISKKLEEFSPDTKMLFAVDEKGGSISLNASILNPKLASGAENKIITVGPFRHNLMARQIYYNGELIPLKRREYDLLVVLLGAYPSVISKKQLAEAIYGENGNGGTAAVILASLTKTLKEAAPESHLLVNRRGIGYVLNFEDTRLSKKFDQAAIGDCIEKGIWRIYPTQWRAEYLAGDSPVSFILPKGPFNLLQDIVSSYPSSTDIGDRLATFYQLDNAIGEAIGSWRGKFRRIGKEKVRLDMDPDDVPKEILDACEVVTVGPWELDSTLDQIRFDGDPVDLTEVQYLVMKSLISAYPSMATYQQIQEIPKLERISIPTTLSILREALKEKHNITMEWLSNIRGQGYRLIVNADEVSEDLSAKTRRSDLGGLVLNHDARQLEVSETSIPLTSAEYILLSVLEKQSKPLNAEEIILAAIDHDKLYEEATIKQAFFLIGQKLKDRGLDRDKVIKLCPIGYYLSVCEDEIIKQSEIKLSGPISVNHTLQTLSHTPTQGEKAYTVSLTPAEFAVIGTLSKNFYKPFTLEEMRNIVAEEGEEFSESTLRIVGSTVKAKLVEEGDSCPDILSSRKGYYFFDHMADKLNWDSSIKGNLVNKNLINVGPIVIDTKAFSISYESAQIPMPRQLLELMMCLSAEPGSALSSASLAGKVLGEDGEVNKGKIRMGISALRRIFDRVRDGLGSELIQQSHDDTYILQVPDWSPVSIEVS